ncbi:MAG: DUF177 domain-containing protein [Bacteroidetes bacterium]|nr:DUF177 domain-containing protein [Bacteroidota bacterium]
MSRERQRHRPAMEIDIAGVGDGEYAFAFDVPASAINLDESFLGNVKVEGTLRKVSSQFFLTSTITRTYVRECDRCLAEIRVEGSIPLTVYYRTEFGDRRGLEDEDNVVTLEPDQESIVLDDEVRDAILLDLPAKMLCREECKGLCPGCGADLNNDACRCETPAIDPRWEKLAEMLKKNGDQE